MSELMEAAKRATPEELAELAEMIESAKRKKVKAQAIKRVVTLDMTPRDVNGRPLSEEEIYDREHPLMRIPYGYIETTHSFGHRPKMKVWSMKEVDDHNHPIEEAWLTEKRKYFPDVKLPHNDDLRAIQAKKTHEIDWR